MAFDLKENWPLVAGIAVIGAGGLMILKSQGTSGVATTIVSNPGAAQVAQSSLTAQSQQQADIENALHDFLTSQVQSQEISANQQTADAQIAAEPALAQIAAQAQIAAAQAEASAITAAANSQAQAEIQVAQSQQQASEQASKRQGQSNFWNSLFGAIGNIFGFLGFNSPGAGQAPANPIDAVNAQLGL